METPHKISTPIRIVIDCSCRTTSGKSLNDIQFKGQAIQDELFNILLRFRKHRFIVNADIQRIYTNIQLHPTQQLLQYILWREHRHDPLKTYKLTTLSFGLKSAPYLATRCLKQLADENEQLYPAASSVIKTDFFMDDLLCGGAGGGWDRCPN